MIRTLIVALAGVLLLVSGTLGQQKGAAKKSFVLTGKVEGVSESSSTLTVNHGNIEGYMAAMTMPYKVDKPEVLKKVKTGDQIKATVYDGDYTLYNIEVLPPVAGKKK